MRYYKRCEQLLILASVRGEKCGRDICCPAELLERAAFPSICFPFNEQSVTRTAQDTRTKDILYIKIGNVKNGVKFRESVYCLFNK